LPDYLDKYISTLSDSQQAQMQKMVVANQDEESTIEDLTNKIEKEILDLGNIPSEPVIIIRKQEGRTNSSDYNAVLTEIKNDLVNLFSESAKIDQIITDHERYGKSVLANIEKEIKKIEDKTNIYEIVAFDKDSYSQNIYETFRNRSNFDDNSKYIVDRDGNSSEVVALNNTAEAISLPVSDVVGRIIGGNGAQLAEIKIMEQVGSGFIQYANKKHSIDKAIDGSNSSFWCEVILGDKPFSIPMYDYHGNKVVESGAACKFVIKFDSISSINEIIIKPFSEFPLNIVNIWAYENLNFNTVPIALLSEEIISDEPIVIQFPAIKCQKLEFIINQKNYTKQIYLITEKQANNIEMWQKVSQLSYDGESELTHGGSSWVEEDDDLPIITHGELDKYWNEFEDKFSEIVNNKMVNNDDFVKSYYRVIASLLGDDSAKRLVNKFEYVYGAYEIDVNGKTYSPSGVYVSREIPTVGNIRQIALNTDEKHTYVAFNDSGGLEVCSPDREGSFQATSAEWYISPVENPSLDDWIPILPSEYTDSNGLLYVPCELLLPNVLPSGDIVCKTRFPYYIPTDLLPDGATVPVIRCNGEIIEFGIDYLFSDNDTIVMLNYEPNSVYSISYYVNVSFGDYVNISLDDPPATIRAINKKAYKETFKGVDSQRRVKLSRSPYIDYASINLIEASGEKYNPNLSYDSPETYQPIKVAIRRGTKIFTYATTNDKIDGEWDDDVKGRTYNRTDYITKKNELLTKYDADDHPTYDYRQNDRYITFADMWDKETEISVEYLSTVNNVRVKCILRRIYGDGSITPIINEYLLKLATINM
jgi:hypothetical protein